MAETVDGRGEDRRHEPRFDAAALGAATVRLLGGGDVQLINFSERGLLFQSESRLLVGARATLRIARGSETITAAGTVVRSLVQGMVGGKLQFRTALSLDQPLALAAGLSADLAAAETSAELEAALLAAAGTSAGAEAPGPATGAGEAAAIDATPRVPEVDEEPGAVEGTRDGAGEAQPTDPDAVSAEPGASEATALTPLSVLFVSTTSERTTRLQRLLAAQPAVTLETALQATIEQLTRAAAARDVLLFDSALGPDALGRLVTALRGTPMGAAVVLLVSGAELPPDITALANGCVADTESGEALADALRDAAWTPWQPVPARPSPETSRADLYLRMFDALPVPVVVVNQAGRITVANISASRRLTAPGEELMIGRALSSLVDPEASGPLAALLEVAFDGQQGSPLATTLAADLVPVTLRPISLVPGPDDAPELAIRCEIRQARAAVIRRPPDVEPPAAPAPPAADVEARVAALEAELQALRATAAALERDLAVAAEWRRGADAGLEALERRHAEAIAALRAERDEARDQCMALVDEIGAARAEIEALRDEAAARDAGADADADAHADTERLVRALTGERDAAIARALQLTAGRDEALDRLDAERTRAEAALAELAALKARQKEPVAAAAAPRRGRKLLAEEEPALPAARLQRMLDDVRAELRTERELRKELETQLDENAEALERTIQSYESKLEAAERRQPVEAAAKKPRKK